MKLSAKVASALSFAHLAGLGRKSKAGAAEDDKDRDHEDVTDGAKKGKAADDEDGPTDEDKNKEAVRGEDDDPDSQASDDDQPASDDVDGDDKGDKKGKKAKSEGDDDSDEEMSGKSAAAQARRREQARCAAIFASAAAARNPVLAANLAFKTRMKRAEAIAVLEGTPGAVNMHSDRQARNPNVGAGGAAGLNSKQAVDASWDRAFKVANPQRNR
jgi:hypothetical protein